MDRRIALARSKVYEIQVEAIRKRLYDLDEKSSQGGLTAKEDREYDALEIADRQIVKNWRKMRHRAGLSNEAVT